MGATSRAWLPSYAGRQISRRKFIGAAAAGAGAAALIACSGSGGTTERISIDPSGVRKAGNVIYARDAWKLADESKEAVPGGTLRARQSTDLTTSYDWYVANTGEVEGFNDTSYEYLTRTNFTPGVDPGTIEGQTPLGALASGWEVSNDGLTYTFTMRKGVKFHNIAPVNGRVMDINDLRQTAEKYLQIGFNRSAILGILDKFEWPDANHMVWKLKEPYAFLINNMNNKDFAIKFGPKELVRDDKLRAEKQIGTAARMLEKVQPSVDWLFKRHDDYWGGKPFIEKWHYPIIPETATAYAQFVAKNITAFTPSARDILKARGDVPEALMVGSNLSWYGLSRGIFGRYERDTSPWKDPRVRIGIYKTMDHKAIVAFRSNAEAFRAAGVEIDVQHMTHAPRDPSYHLDPFKGELGADGENYKFDVAGARQLFTAAGVLGFDLPVWNLQGSRNDEQNLPLDYMKKAAAEGLYKLEENWLLMQPFYDQVQQTGLFKGYQPYTPAQSSFGVAQFDKILRENYHTNGKAPSFPNAEMDALIMKQLTELDPERRAGIYKDIQRILAKTFQAIPSVWPYASFGFEWPWVHNDYQHVEKKWLDPNMPNRNV